MQTVRRIIFAALTGFIGMLVFYVIAISFPNEIAAKAFRFPGMELLPYLLMFIPDKVVYFLFPEGGLDATASFVFLLSGVFWWIVGTIGAYIVLFRRQTRKNNSEKEKRNGKVLEDRNNAIDYGNGKE